MSDFLHRNVKDKAGLYEATVNLVVNQDPVSPIGDLEQGWLSRTIGTTEQVARPAFATDAEARKIQHEDYKTFYFRKVDGGWLLDTL